MSKKTQSKPNPAQSQAPVSSNTMSPLKRWSIIGVAIFCLLIFSVTGPMTEVIGGWFGGGPPLMATVDLPGGSQEIDQVEYQVASSLKNWANKFGLDPYGGETTQETILCYATLQLLADDLGLVVTGDRLRQYLAPLAQNGPEAYKALYRSYGFGTAGQFEAQFARAMRPLMVIEMLSAGALPTEEAVRQAWADQFEEMDVQYTVWHPSQFEETLAAMTPSEEELSAFFEEDLSAYDRVTLETPQAVTWEGLILEPAALESEAVKAWFTAVAPEEADLDAFYQMNRSGIYRRPAPEEGQEVDPDAGLFLSREEIGEDALLTDYFLFQAMAQLGLDLPREEGADIVAFAAERGVEHLVSSEWIEPQEARDLERVGSVGMNQLFQSQTGVWTSQPIRRQGIAYFVRSTAKRERAMPPLSEIQEEVTALWREARQESMSMEAAEAFLAGLPRGEDYVEGDPLMVDAEEFLQAVAGAERSLEQMGWISRNIRRAVDPIWPTEARVLHGLRSKIGQGLDDMMDGQVIGPEDFGEDGVAVAHLKGRRAADAEQIWPAEMANARARALRDSQTAFVTDQLSFEGLADAYGLTKMAGAFQE